MSNKGLIAAPYKLVAPSTAMGLCFSFSPTEGMVSPGACHALVVHFSSNQLGTFDEDFHFSVVGNPQPLTLTFRYFSTPRNQFCECTPAALAICTLRNLGYFAILCVQIRTHLTLPLYLSYCPSLPCEVSRLLLCGLN